MPVRSHSKREETSEEPPVLPVDVGAYESRPGRLVFVEDGNANAWIATDHAVDLPR